MGQQASPTVAGFVIVLNFPAASLGPYSERPRQCGTMHIGLLTLEIHLPEAHSLKEKRLVLRSLKDRLRKFNISIAECDHQDLWQRATLGVVAISSDHVILEKTLNAVVDETEKLILAGLNQYHIEYL